MTARREEKAKPRCSIAGCEEEASSPAGGPCRKCRSGLYYWKAKRPAERLARRGRLIVFQHRIEELI